MNPYWTGRGKSWPRRLWYQNAGKLIMYWILKLLIPAEMFCESLFCGEPAISLHSHHVSLVQWTTCLLPVTRDPGSIPRGYLCETRILLLALSRYNGNGDPDVIDHHGLVWGGLCPKPSLGPRADNVIIPLDLTQLSCPSFKLAAGLPFGFTTDRVGCWGEPCGEPAISLHSHHVSLLQWTTCLLPVTRDPGSNPQGGTYVKPVFSC